MTAAPKPSDAARILALAEDGLRRCGFGEAAIQRSRKANRAVIEARLAKSQTND